MPLSLWSECGQNQRSLIEPSVVLPSEPMSKRRALLTSRLTVKVISIVFGVPSVARTSVPRFTREVPWAVPRSVTPSSVHSTFEPEGIVASEEPAVSASEPSSNVQRCASAASDESAAVGAASGRVIVKSPWPAVSIAPPSAETETRFKEEGKRLEA